VLVNNIERDSLIYLNFAGYAFEEQIYFSLSYMCLILGKQFQASDLKCFILIIPPVIILQKITFIVIKGNMHMC
jgi:hypothetical protein